MIKLGDLVKIIRVCKSFSEENEREQYGWAHGAIAVVKDIADDSLLPDRSRQPYYVEFENQPIIAIKGLWCSYVEPVFEEVILPKELFEI